MNTATIKITMTKVTIATSIVNVITITPAMITIRITLSPPLPKASPLASLDIRSDDDNRYNVGVDIEVDNHMTRFFVVLVIKMMLTVMLIIKFVMLTTVIAMTALLDVMMTSCSWYNGREMTLVKDPRGMVKIRMVLPTTSVMMA
jgi:hypothetical protein